MIPLKDENPTERTAIVTYALIAACISVFLWQASLPERAAIEAVYALGVTPAVLFGHARLPPDTAMVPPVATLVTSMFLHGDVMHLAGNMLFLWIFGNNIEDEFGHGRFTVFYLLCGLAAAVSQIVPAPASTVPMIGASGAISGVLGAYLVRYPNARVLVLIPLGWFFWLVRWPAYLVLGLWFTVQIGSALAAPAGAGGVAWWAHIGGFVAGIVLLPVFRIGRRPRPRRGPWG